MKKPVKEHCGARSTIICRVTGVCGKNPNIREARGSHERVTSDPSGVSRTQQAEKDQTDINNIVNRYHRTGALPPPKYPDQPVFADVTPMQADTFGDLINRSNEVVKKYETFRTDYAQRAADVAQAALAAKQASASTQPVLPISDAETGRISKP